MNITNIITFAEQLCIIKKKLFSLLVDKNNAHQVHRYDVKNQIYLSLSPMFCRRTFPSKLKVLKTNVICYMAKQEQVMCSTHVMVQRIFSSWPLSPTRFTTFFGGLWNLLYHSLKKSPFILSKGLLCLYDNQNSTWLLAVM